jgi:predicted MFS family arabinose efflux permease
VPAAFALARHLPERSTHGPGSADHAVGAVRPTRSTYLALLAPTAVLLSVTLAGGAIITFAPQLVQVPWLSAAGLLALGLTSTVTRWRIGAVADRIGGQRLLLPFLGLLVLSLLGLAWLVREPVGPGLALWWVLACAAVGVSYGALQNLTMLQAFAAAGPRRVGAASAVWNAGYDTGTAVGSLLVGAVAVVVGFGWATALTAGLCLLAVPLTLRPRS